MVKYLAENERGDSPANVQACDSEAGGVLSKEQVRQTWSEPY